jgi:hypothetical protein
LLQYVVWSFPSHEFTIFSSDGDSFALARRGKVSQPAMEMSGFGAKRFINHPESGLAHTHA